jgi:hypothetical protein
MYFPYTTSQQLPGLLQSLKEKEAARQQVEAATLDVVYPGEQQPEADHNFKGDNTSTGTFKEQHFRKGRGWFSYDLRNINGEARRLSFTYFGNDKDSEFEIYLNNQLATTIVLQGNEGNEFRTKTIAVPVALQPNATITVQFKARDQKSIAAIYEVRLLR